jgi:hypothetical protein
MIRQSIQSETISLLPALFESLGFTHRVGTVLSLAVAVTRGISIPQALVPFPISANESLPLDEDLVDAMSVVFMFNVVNRIANAFDIAPEWAMFGRIGIGRRIAQWIMSIGLPWHMSLDGLDETKLRIIAFDLVVPAHEAGIPVQHYAAIWPEIKRHPSLSTAIYQMLWASLTCSELSGELLRRCVESVTRTTRDSPILSTDMLSQYCAAIYFHPFRFLSADYPAARLGLTEDQKLEVTFRIAIAAAFEKMHQYQQALQQIGLIRKTN